MKSFLLHFVCFLLWHFKLVLILPLFLLQAKEYFEKAAENEDPGGYYNLGVLYLKGMGVKKDVKRACKFFILASNQGQPKAFYQLAKMFHTGVGLKKSLETVCRYCLHCLLVWYIISCNLASSSLVPTLLI